MKLINKSNIKFITKNHESLQITIETFDKEIYTIQSLDKEDFRDYFLRLNDKDVMFVEIEQVKIK